MAMGQPNERSTRWLGCWLARCKAEGHPWVRRTSPGPPLGDGNTRPSRRRRSRRCAPASRGSRTRAASRATAPRH